MPLYFVYPLLIIAGAASISGLVASVLQLKGSLAAQKSFLNLLTADPTSAKLLALRERMVAHGMIDMAELQQLTLALERISRSLPEKQRLQIEKGLFQDSVPSRARYAEMLLDKAGIGVGLPRIAVR